jgi:hypothetical protein
MELAAVEFVKPDIDCAESAPRWAAAYDTPAGVAYPVELTGVRRVGGKVDDGLADWG